MFDIIREDLRVKARFCCGNDSTKSLMRVLVWDGTFATMYYRASQFCYRHHLGVVGAILNQLNAILTHATIGRGAVFGPGLVILHSIGLSINSAVRAGSNIYIEKGVSIGSDKGHAPVLGNNIYIGAGACIIGKVTVGNNVRISANAVVMRDVPDDASVVAPPSLVLKLGSKKPDIGTSA